MHRIGQQPQRSARHELVARTRTAGLPATGVVLATPWVLFATPWRSSGPCMDGIGDVQGDAAP